MQQIGPAQALAISFCKLMRARSILATALFELGFMEVTAAAHRARSLTSSHRCSALLSSVAQVVTFPDLGFQGAG
jgi:hypothetical protein